MYVGPPQTSRRKYLAVSVVRFCYITHTHVSRLRRKKNVQSSFNIMRFTFMKEIPHWSHLVRIWHARQSYAALNAQVRTLSVDIFRASVNIPGRPNTAYGTKPSVVNTYINWGAGNGPAGSKDRMPSIPVRVIGSKLFIWVSIWLF